MAQITLNSSGVASNGTLALQSNGTTTAVTIDTSQNVGIGRSPNYQLDVYRSGTTNTTVASANDNVVNILQVSGNTAGVIGTITSHPLLFTAGNTERMRIDTSGNLLVGTTTGATSRIVTQADGTSTYGITCNMTAASGTRYHIVFRENGTERGTVTSNGSATSYNTSSDYRLKENIAPMTGALQKVALIKPVTYTWKSTGEADEGFIAHELQEVCPSAVTGEKDAVETYTDEEGVEQTRPVYQGIDTSFLVATLTAAIQELKALVDTQASTITQLQADVAALKGTA